MELGHSWKGVLGLVEDQTRLENLPVKASVGLHELSFLKGLLDGKGFIGF